MFTTVGSEEKAELARGAGADHVILYRDVDFKEAVESIAGPRPLDVVYDGVGKSVFTQSLGLLRMRGMMVTFGNASGPVDPISPLELSANGSLFLTRPTLFHHTTTQEEIQRRADDLFGWIGAGELDVRIGARFALRDAADAHRALESRGDHGQDIADSLRCRVCWMDLRRLGVAEGELLMVHASMRRVGGDAQRVGGGDRCGGR